VAGGRRAGRLGGVALVFLKLGTIAFGGPAAHVAMMRDEAVVRRGWLDDQEFVDALGATSVLPGPGSTQLAIYLGRRRAGWPGLVVAGASFILPAMVVVTALAWAYVRYGTTVAGQGLLYGIKPMVISVVAWAVLGLGRTAVRGPLALLAAAAAFGLYFAGVNVLVILLGSGAVVMVVRNRHRLGRSGAPALLPLAPPVILAAGASTKRVHLSSVFWEFLKLGSIVFGSGYVLLAYLRNDLVHALGWITVAQLLDAVAIGQLTPGPVFTTATFIGYLVAGVPGAVVATCGIFLPSFLLVAVLGPVIPRLRRSAWTAGALDGVNAAAIGLMAAVDVVLARSALVDPLTVILAVVSFLLLARFRVNSAWLVLAGAAVGLVHGFA
jgi:chromate transporter